MPESIQEGLELYPQFNTVPFLVTAFFVIMLVFMGLCFAIMAGPDTYIFDSSIIYEAEHRPLLNWESQAEVRSFAEEV